MDTLDPRTAGCAWGDLEGAGYTPIASGLINRSWAIDGARGVLQWLNTSIFDPKVHEDIEAISAFMADRGMTTPRLVRTRDGGLWHTDAQNQVWRRFTWVGDRTVEKLKDPADARSAGALVARFHAATADCDWAFKAKLRAFHDTPAKMAALEAAVSAGAAHRLYDRVAPLAEQILGQWRAWNGPTGLPLRIVHGDLKISNVRFAGPDAVALIDLDTLGRGAIDAELGDAFRSWCNPATEDDPHPVFDLELFGAAIHGYAPIGRERLSAPEWSSIVPGVERICLELAARFAADALEERYFGWDATRFSTRGDHNLARAAGQAALARAVLAAKADAEAILTRA